DIPQSDAKDCYTQNTTSSPTLPDPFHYFNTIACPFFSSQQNSQNEALRSLKFLYQNCCVD
ncbi:unnamed protein product, partial [Timema podura]|nr:unnamed protein product [Timema podura]